MLHSLYIEENDLKKIAVPLKEVDKVISHYIFKKKRKFLNKNDVIWKSPTNNHKRNVWVHSRSERKTILLPNGKYKLLDLLVEGNCDLSIDYKISSSNFGQDYASQRVDHYYYVFRENEPTSTVFKGSGEFIKTKKINYFDDCKEAKKFLKAQPKLSQLQLEKLVRLYNNQCGKEKSTE